MLVTAEDGTKLPFDQEMIPCHFWNPTATVAERKKALVEFWEKNINRPPIVKSGIDATRRQIEGNLYIS